MSRNERFMNTRDNVLARCLPRLEAEMFACTVLFFCVIGCGGETTDTHLAADVSLMPIDLNAEVGVLFADMGTLSTDGLVQDGSAEAVDLSFADAAGALEMGTASEGSLSTQYIAGTHNSYSGGARGSIVAQLNRGIRCIEFDFHDNDFEGVGDYRLGHTSHDSEVELGGGNPRTSELTQWLELVAQWSDDHAGHGPLIVLLDAKDNLKDNLNPESGNLGRLNDIVRTTLGQRLYLPAGADANPQVSALRNRILVVLSGDRITRTAYIADEGEQPAVSSHASGAVVSMHSDGRNRLWYWTGRLEPNASKVRWLQHGRYDTGTEPSVLLTASNVVVEVHRSHTRDRLFGAVGDLDDGGRLNWRDERSLFDGQNPSLTLTADGRIKLVYETSEFSSGRAQRFGRVVDGELRFDEAQSTQQFGADVSNNGVLEIIASGIAGHSDTTLLYRMATETDFDFVRYEQLMFTEYQSGDGAFLADQAVFAGFKSGRTQELTRNLDRYITRLWGYDQGDSTASIQPNLLSADEPFATWFDQKMQALSALDW